MEELPTGIDLDRHVLLHGRGRHPGYRRALFALVCAIPVLALIDVFGQQPDTDKVQGTMAELSVQAPGTLRGGLLYQVRLDVTAHQDMKQPQLVLGPGWWDQMTENSVNPQPIDSSTSNGRVTLSYQPLHSGQKLTVWLQFQVNPVNHYGTRDIDVLLTDGATPVAQVNRKLTLFP